MRRTSEPCNHFAVFGCHGKQNEHVVSCVSQIKTKNEPSPLKQNLTCAKYGNYVATCVIFHQRYAGETADKSSTKWSSHPSNWQKRYNMDDSDHMA